MITPLDARILIVDDQESNVLLLQNILKDEGYTHLETTLDSRQVVSLVKKIQPDLILLDLMMPHLDGYAVMEQLRVVIPPDTYLPILILTADVTAQAKQRALSMGAKDFLTKPFDQVEVLLRIKNLLETRALHLQQQRQNQMLEEKVRERTAQIQRQLERLNALRIIDMAIAGSVDLRLTLKIALEQIVTQLGVDAADVLLLIPHTQTLEYAAGRGFRTDALQHTHLRLGEGYAGIAGLERKTIRVSNLREHKTDFLRSPYFKSEGFDTYFGTPLIVKGEVKGVVEFFHRKPFEASSEWLEFLETLAGQVAIAVDSAQLFTNLQRSNVDLVLAYDATIESLSHALDLRDKETEGHSKRVTEMTVNLARAMNVSEAELAQVRRGALLHDIGKLGVPDDILLKPGPLTDKEWVIMRKHTQYAYDMLSPIAFLHPALDIPYCHHEKWDGTGYPRGLKGEQIPLAARIFAVIDVYDALNSDRSYRAAWPKEKVLAHIREQTGRHFDPAVVEAFLQMVSGE